MFRKTLITLAMTAALALPCSADDAAITGVGGAVKLMDEHATVRMLSEKVDVKFTGSLSCKVRCEFVFKNEGEATTVKMGFPEESWGDISYSEKSCFGDFRSWVDGERVRTTFLPAEKAEERDYTAWHVKNVRFAAGQTRAVVNEYVSGLGMMSDGSMFFVYVMRTGASWKGKIGRATITVDASRVPRHLDVSCTPAGYTRKGQRFEWPMEDFEPDEDIHVSLSRPLLFTLNDNAITSRECPVYFVRDGLAMASLRSLESHGPAVTVWNARMRSCVVHARGQTLQMAVGSTKAVVNGSKEIVLPRAPVLARGTFVAPVASVVRALGGSAEYEEKRRLMHLHLRKK